MGRKPAMPIVLPTENYTVVKGERVSLDDPRGLSMFAQRIRKLRYTLPENGRSGREFAMICKVTAGSLSNWEQGLFWCDPSAAALMCRRFGVTMDWVFLGDESGLSAKIHRQLAEAEEAVRTEQEDR
jgi:transcriptional regulator with XRE-family HTH domain